MFGQKERMNMQARISEAVYKNVADIFLLSRDYVAAHPELRFREDLHAKSLQYFPLIGALETDLDIELDYHRFQNEARTVGLAIDFVSEACNNQHH